LPNPAAIKTALLDAVESLIQRLSVVDPDTPMALEGRRLVESVPAMKPVAETLVEANVGAEEWLAIPGLADSPPSYRSDKSTNDSASKCSIVLVADKSANNCAGDCSSASRNVLSLRQ
jgi:hypothetical protein